MRLLGIDYGEKRIGLALSDEEGMMAFPYAVVVNDKQTLRKLVSVCADQGVGLIILGESKNLTGEQNMVSAKIAEFKNALEKEINIPVIYHSEVFSSAQAERIIGKDEFLDARAAVIILQSYIDSQKSV